MPATDGERRQRERRRESVICSALDVSGGVALFAAETALVSVMFVFRARSVFGTWMNRAAAPGGTKALSSRFFESAQCRLFAAARRRIFCNGKRGKRRLGRERKMLVISNEHKFHFAYFVAENDKQSACAKVNYCSLCRSFISEPRRPLRRSRHRSIQPCVCSSAGSSSRVQRR